MTDVLASLAIAGGFIVYWTGALAALYLPLALAYIFWERRALARAADYTPSVSVLVPAFNEEATIEASVQSILAADYPDFEVIVIDDGSTDRTVERLAAFAQVRHFRLMRQANSGKGAALNAGIAVARGELTLFTDADTLFERDTIRQATRYFADPEVGAMGGNDTPLHPHGWLQQLLVVTSHIGTGYVRRALSMLRVLPIIPGNLGVVRTAILRDIGGFRAIWGEDLELTWRLHRHGVRIVYGAQARVIAECPSTLRSLWRQRVRWIRSYIRILNENRDMIARPRFGRFGAYLLLNAANSLLVPLLQLLLLIALPWMLAHDVLAPDLLGWIAFASIGWLYIVAVIAILLDRSPRHFLHLPCLILLVPLSQLYSAIVAWSIWAEWRAQPERWLKSVRRNPQVAAEQVRIDAGRRGVVLAGASVVAMAGAATFLGSRLPRQRKQQIMAREIMARADGLQLAIGMHFPDWPDWREAYRSLLERPELAAIHRVALSAGRPDWNFYRSTHGRQWWSRDQLRESVDMLAEAADALHKRGLATTAMLDVFAPRWLSQNPQFAAHDVRGRPNPEIVCSTAASAGAYQPFLVDAIESLAASTTSDTVAVTELFYDRTCFCARCLASFGSATGSAQWPRRQNGSINLLDRQLGDWRSHQVASLVKSLRAAARRHGKALAVDVRLSRDDLARNSRENGQDYQLLRTTADELVVWDYFALDNVPPAESQAIARHVGAQLGRTPWWHSIGLWDSVGQTVSAGQMRIAMDAAIRGGARRLWITPAKRLGESHWQQIAALTAQEGANT